MWAVSFKTELRMPFMTEFELRQKIRMYISTEGQ